MSMWVRMRRWTQVAGPWAVVALLAAGSARAQAPAASAGTPPAVSAGTPGEAAAAPPPAPEPRLGFEPEDFQASDSAAESLSGVWALVVKTSVGLAAVLLVIYLVLGKGLPRLGGFQQTGRALRIVDRIGLESRKTLYLVEVDGQRALVGTTDTNITLMMMPEPESRAAGSSQRGAADESAAGAEVKA
jgi:flagellar biogenesis protein FliO